MHKNRKQLALTSVNSHVSIQGSAKNVFLNKSREVEYERGKMKSIDVFRPKSVGKCWKNWFQNRIDMQKDWNLTKNLK